LLIFSDQPGSSLDPSGIHEPGKKSLTSKMGLDCTIPWGADKAKFTRGEYGPVDVTDYIA
jgi:3-polyprenyl-4-hydroxybenzoate decarboxylase